MDQKLWVFEVLGEIRAAKEKKKLFGVGFFFINSSQSS
jgi:hypothetical protein